MHHLPEAGDSYQARRVLLAVHRCTLLATNLCRYFYPVMLPTCPPPFLSCHVLQGVDVSHEIARYGLWQPNNVLGWPPAVVEEFLSGLPRRAGAPALPLCHFTLRKGVPPRARGSVNTAPHRAQAGLPSVHANAEPPNGSPRPVVVDIGAGYGMFTLAAAARGFQVRTSPGPAWSRGMSERQRRCTAHVKPGSPTPPALLPARRPPPP